jgi:hypothetical protein
MGGGGHAKTYGRLKRTYKQTNFMHAAIGPTLRLTVVPMSDSLETPASTQTTFP